MKKGNRARASEICVCTVGIRLMRVDLDIIHELLYLFIFAQCACVYARLRGGIGAIEMRCYNCISKAFTVERMRDLIDAF